VIFFFATEMHELGGKPQVRRMLATCPRFPFSFVLPWRLGPVIGCAPLTVVGDTRPPPQFFHLFDQDDDRLHHLSEMEKERGTKEHRNWNLYMRSSIRHKIITEVD
jgi:hypothetical protein